MNEQEEAFVAFVTKTYRPMPWGDEALCYDDNIDADLFFPERGESITEAREICASCPVLKECLTYAVHNPEPHGVWGGASDTERQRLRRDFDRTTAISRF